VRAIKFKCSVDQAKRCFLSCSQYYNCQLWETSFRGSHGASVET